MTAPIMSQMPSPIQIPSFNTPTIAPQGGGMGLEGIIALLKMSGALGGKQQNQNGTPATPGAADVTKPFGSDATPPTPGALDQAQTDGGGLSAADPLTVMSPSVIAGAHAFNMPALYQSILKGLGGGMGGLGAMSSGVQVPNLQAPVISSGGTNGLGNLASIAMLVAAL